MPTISMYLTTELDDFIAEKAAEMKMSKTKFICSLIIERKTNESIALTQQNNTLNTLKCLADPLNLIALSLQNLNSTSQPPHRTSLFLPANQIDNQKELLDKEDNVDIHKNDSDQAKSSEALALFSHSGTEITEDVQKEVENVQISTSQLPSWASSPSLKNSYSPLPTKEPEDEIAYEPIPF